MASVLFWLGSVVVVVGVVTAFVPGRFRTGMCLGGGGLLLSVTVLLTFTYGPSIGGEPLRLPADPKPIAVALAFEDDTPPAERRRGILHPGLANEHLARWLTAHAASFSHILAQEGIILAAFPNGFQDGDRLDGTAVYRIHRHDGAVPVRTLEALCCARQRLGDRPLPGGIALLSHPRQFTRARRDLESLGVGPVLDPGLRDVPYRDRSWIRPLAWAFRELAGARPLDWAQRTFFKNTSCRCREEVIRGLGPIP